MGAIAEDEDDVFGGLQMEVEARVESKQSGRS